MAEHLVHRAVRDADIDGLYALLNHPIINHQISFDACSREEFGPILEEMRASGDFRVVESSGLDEAAIPGGIVGCYLLKRGTLRFRHAVHIGCVGVHPEMQGRGIGRRMITELLDELRREGLKRVELTVAADNPRGIAFWTAMGFTPEGRMRKYFSRAGQAELGDEIGMALLFD